MAKYRSYRGVIVDMEELRRKNEKTSAAGNMGTNANGDVLGPGGKIIEKAQARAQRHYVSKDTVSKTNVSIKGDQQDEKVFEDEASKEDKRTRPGGSNTVDNAKKSKVEKETESGDIILEDEE
jgi:hypothetical protein